MNQPEPTAPHNDQAAPSYVVDENYAAAALERVRAAVRGNGIKPDQVHLQKLIGSIASFPVTVNLQLRVRTIEKVVAGKKGGGEKVDGAQGMRDAVERERVRALTSDDIVNRIKRLVLERQDKGLGIRNEIIKLPFLSKEYVHYQACRSCGAQGKLKCQRCHAKGYEICPRCNGQSMEMCAQCRGAKLVHMGNGQQPCPRCNGQGKTPCTMCNQTRKIPCPACRASGFIQCASCHGAAWNTYITSAEMDVIGTFGVDKSKIPEKLLNFLETKAKEIPLYGDILVAPPRPSSQDGAVSDNIPLDYQINLPYADADIMLAKETRAHLFLMGRQGDIADANAFLEPLLKRGMEMLAEAGQGRGNVARKIHRAGQYRTIRQAIIASSRYPKKKAARLLMKNTPVGISPGAIKNLITNADKAMKNITAGPRRNGIAAGAGLAAILYALYLMTPARPALTGFVDNQILHLAVDGIVLALGMTLAVFTIQFMGARAIRKALGKLLGPDQQNSITSKTGHSGLWAALACAAMFMIVCEFSLHVPSGEAPSWYRAMRAIDW